jgi:hypothetical protein
MFANSGMVQFKNLFTGVEHRDYVRATTGAEMRAGGRQAQRSRQCGLYRAAPYLLRDARQFLLRGLLQGRRDSLCLEPRHQGVRDRPEAPSGHRLPHRRRGGGDLEEGGRAAGRADHPHPHQRQLLDDGAHGPLRAVHRDLLRPWRPHPGRTSGEPGRRRRPVHRDLEPRLHAVRAVRGRRAQAPPEPVDRHGHGVGARGCAVAGQARQL